MGSALGVHFHADQPSLIEPGKLSCISDPIVGHDLGEFYDEFVDILKDPCNFLETAFIHDLEISPDPAGEGVENVKVMIDGDKLRRHVPEAESLGLPEGIFCRTWMRYKTNRSQWSLESSVIRVETGDPEHTTTLTFVPDAADNSFRLECFVLDPNEGNKRVSSDFVARVSEDVYLKPILVVKSLEKVKVHSNVWMESTGGRSIVTEALDEYCTAAQLFEAIVQHIKQEAIDASGEVEYISKGEFHTTVRVDFPLPDSRVVNVALARKTFLDEDGMWASAGEYMNDELIHSRFWRIHDKPVRIEAWVIRQSGFRHATAKDALLVKLFLMKLTSEADIREQVEDLGADKGNFFF